MKIYHVRHPSAYSTYDIGFHSKLSSETATYTRWKPTMKLLCCVNRMHKSAYSETLFRDQVDCFEFESTQTRIHLSKRE